ncbi:MAG: hypothetical protein AYK22_06400 [Thermoplasmatales archaeon SG8-52-3]|nr:MAG: hypothetical protein AYK22_06400 [Thermoplasmatales archaeon SG8-52-3]
MKLKKFILIVAIITIISPFYMESTFAISNPGQIYEGNESLFYRNVTVYAPAVASTENGYVGVISTITVTIQSNGSGRVFVDTLPLTEVDMQGSARLAVKVASALVKNDENCDVDPSKFDYFFVVRTSSPVIGGPSAGGIMTVATISLLENWEMDNRTVMTGMINPDGSIGPIGGIPQKIDAAYSVGATHFLIPKGQGTYTEMVTTTVNGWITTVKPVSRNIADYAMENYGITVTEVADINEALGNFTGYNILFNETETIITTDDYINAIKPLASTLLENARSEYANASSEIENTSIPNNYPNYYRYDLIDSLKVAEDNLKESEEAYENETYYTSTSESFQSLIYSRFIIYTCDYWNTDQDTFLQDLLNSAKVKYNNAAYQAKNAEINGYISLQTVGAAQRRATEAKEELDSAESSFNNGLFLYTQVLDFLYKIAFIYERSNSIGWWINIGSNFNETGDLDKDILDDLALEYIEEAQQATIYSSIILNEIGSSGGNSANYLPLAEELLISARRNLENDYPALAFFEALEATVRANLVIELIGFEPKDKIEIASESANNNIAKSRQQGIEPVLAVSYYEFAHSLTNDSEYDSALLYFRYGGMIAGALGLTEFTGGTSSRYVGIPEIFEHSSLNLLLQNLGIVISIVILAGALGIIVGIIISVLVLKREEKQIKVQDNQLFEIRNLQKNNYFSENEIPRSIKDYYKKQK